MKKSLKTLSFIPSLWKAKCMLLLVMLFTFSFAYGQTDEKTQKASALRMEGTALHDQGSYLIYGRTLADEGEYYKAIACFGINALLVGEKVGTLEAALKEWENKNITPNSGPLSTLSLNKVKEVLKSEPSKYGKLYDIFTTVIPAICRDTLGTPVPFSYAYDLTDDGIMPFFSELKRQGLLECFFHVAMKNAKVQYKSNTEWLTAHKGEEERLWKTIGKLDVFKKDLKYGYVPDPVEFKTAEAAHQHNIDAMAACKFYMTHTLDSKGMPNVKKYIVTWSAASPDVNIVIGKQAMDLTMTNADYLLAYIAGCSYYALTSHQKGWNIDTFSSGITEVVKLYAANKDILGKNKNLDKLLKLYQSEGDGYKKFIEESFKKEK